MDTSSIFLLVNKGVVVFLLAAPTAYLLIVLYLFRAEIKKSLPQIGAFFFLTVIFLNKLLLGTKSLAQKDFNNIQIPYWHFFKTSISNYFLPPVWNSSFCGGFDTFASPLAGYFSAFNWVFLLGDNIYRSFNFFILIQIFLCLVFSYLMLRSFSFSKSSSVLGAVIFSFNGFVTMRLSPSVGLEYLFAYKWLPLILAFTKRYFDGGKKIDLIGLAIVFAFSLEGNPNMVIGMGVLWMLYVAVNSIRIRKIHLQVFLAPVFSLLIYALKTFPVIDLFSSGNLRFSEAVGGWRGANFDLYMYPEVFFPVKLEFTNGTFTPGLIAIVLFFVSLVAAVVSFRKTGKPPFRGFYFVTAAFILSFFLTIENPVYYFFYSLPILDKVTIIPPFLVFYIIPIVFFCSYGFTKLVAFFEGRKFISMVLFTLPVVIFLEVLIGPSLLGVDSYSFNFAKIDYESEPYDFPHYSVLARQDPGNFVVIDEPHLFNYPYASVLQNLHTLNSPNYYFGCNDDTALISSELIDVSRKADYLISMNEINSSDLRHIETVSLSNLLEHKSHAVFERKAEYLSHYETGWSDDLYLYETNCEGKGGCALKNISDNPLSFTLHTKGREGEILTSINYSPWLKVGDLSTHEDEFGFLSVTGPFVGKLEFTYINPYLYIGFAISLASLLFAIFTVKRS